MPYIADTLQQTEEEKKKKTGNLEQQGDISVTTSPTEVQAGVSPTVTQQGTAGKLGTGMKGTSAQKYVQAHQDPKLAEQMTGKLKQEESGLSKRATEETSGLQTKTGFALDQGQLKQIGGGEIERIQKAQQQIPGIYQKSAADIQSFMKTPEYQEYLTAKKGGFNIGQAEGLPQLQVDVGAFQQRANLGTSERGRFQLLREMFTRPEKTYTTGQQSLDQLLLQSKPQQKAELEEYARGATTGVTRQMTDLEKLQQLAAEKTKQEIQATQEKVKTGAEQAFGGIEQSAVEKLRQYNTNKNRVADLYTKLLSGQSISGEDQNFLRQNTSGDAANRMMEIAKNLSYQTQFGEGVRGRLSRTGTSNWWEGMAPEEAESFTYNYGQLTPDEIRKALATGNIGESFAEKSRFATPEEVAKQKALEDLYQGDIGTNLADVSNKLTPGQIGTEGLGVSGFEKILQERKDKVETAKKEEALEAATAINQYYYDDYGQGTGYGYKPAGRDATTASYKYLRPDSQYANLSDDELRNTLMNDPDITMLYGGTPNTEEARRAIAERAAKQYDEWNLAFSTGESKEDYINRNVAGSGPNWRINGLIDQIIEQRRKIRGETSAREGGYFQQLRQFYGLS